MLHLKNIFLYIAVADLQFSFLFLSDSEPCARFQVVERIKTVFGATVLSDLQETLLNDKDARSSSCSCFVNGTILDNQKSFQDCKSALAIVCGISIY